MLDFRRTLRRSLRAGGEIFNWAYREPKMKPRPLVVIADISGSMERYTRVLLHFIYGMKAALTQPVEAFDGGGDLPGAALLIFGMIMVFAQGSALAPFIYTLF